MLNILLFLVLNQNIEGKVVGVLDGDTIEVLDDRHFSHRIRLAEIDAPEKNQAFGNQAKMALSRKVFGENVKVELRQKDRYGRDIGLVLLDRRNINMEMVEEGYAWCYTQYSRDPRFRVAQNNAQLSRKGLWMDPYAVPPWEFRRAPKTNSSSKSSSKSSSTRRKK